MSPAPTLRRRRPHLVVPLYIYPAPGSWDPLFQAARRSPNVSFIVIVNPCNGPGADALPDSNYQMVLSQLSGLPNVKILGYVYCSYNKRSTAEIEKDITVYSGWSTNFRIDGIFFDEVPSADGDINLMSSLSHFTRSIWNQTTGKSGTVVYNPGVPVGEGFYRDVDMVVAFEQSEYQWQNWYLCRDVAESPAHVRAKDVAIVHSCSSDGKTLARQIVKMGLGGLYLTEQLNGGYTSWPKNWFEVVDVLDQIPV
ncbi:spherulation-specific family 4 [Fusarium longipes]|uniref:Spherulation-specific family 4 n=1 Tax=Fusarium longipes TaxID=694270 RepID=A0A395SZS4_9HYPO|nr:spherulation-specific family 4 [Fusarium longipes]